MKERSSLLLGYFFHKKKKARRFFSVLVSLCLLPAVFWAKDVKYPEFVEEVYLTPQQALDTVFSKADRVEPQSVTLTAEQKQFIERRLGWRLKKDTYEFYKGYKETKLIGYAMITQEIGKFKHFDFIVMATPKFRVGQVEVLVYREPRGGEVGHPRFLRQLKKKASKDHFRINRDIINITGATMSVRAMAAGVKRALLTMETVYANGGQ